MKVYVTTDAHYGLKSAGIDRTPEIHQIMVSVVEEAIESGADMFVHMGDLGHTANPSSTVHSLWVKLFRMLEDARLESRFILGNHDVVNRAGNRSGSLGPLERMGLKHVKAVCEVTSEWPMVKLGPGQGWRFFYLPYLAKAACEGGDRNAIYRRCVREIDTDEPTVVFTHLNIDGASTSDDFLLRPVDAVMPRSLYQKDCVKLILSGHIHGPQTVRKKNPRHEIVGSLISTDFGDVSPKRYAVLDFKGETVKVRFKPTGCIPLVELRYDLVGMSKPVLPIPDTVDDAGVKVRIRCAEDQLALLDLEGFAAELHQRAAFVRPIVPSVIRDQVGKVEAKKMLRPGMDDAAMVAAWVNKKRPAHAQRVAELASEAIGEKT